MSTQNKALRRFVEEEMKISANELEYLAEYVEIEIVPRFQFNTIKLLQKGNNASGEYGPFLPLRPVIVPLWLALQLKQQRLCSISAPSWMSIAKLEETLENERQSREKNLLTDVEYYYQEISKLLLNHSPESLEDVEKVRILIKDIEELRASKLHASLRELNEYHEAVRIPNASAAELNSVRAFMMEAMKKFSELKKSELAASGEASQAASQQVGSL